MRTLKVRALDLSVVLDAWPTAAPSTSFADRVLAAYDPASSPAVKARWPIYACAAVLAVIVLPLFSGAHRDRSPTGSPVLAQGPDLDLGLQTD